MGEMLRVLSLVLLTCALAACGEESLEPPHCDAISAGPAQWITENEVFDVALVFTCERKQNTSSLAAVDVQFDDLPDGADFEPETGRLRWTPGLDQAATYDLRFRRSVSTRWGELRIGVADAFADPDNVPIVDPERYRFEYGLPVFFIQDSEHDSYHASELVYAGHRYPGTQIKTRGQTSLAYPKHSYTIKFDDDDLFQEPGWDGGLLHRKKLVLTTTFDDNAYVRQRLAHTLWGMLSSEHIPVRSYNAVVYRDKTYMGVYVVSDHVDRHLMRYNGLLDSGELFKSKTHEGNLLSADHAMEKKEGLPIQGEAGWDDSLQRLIELVRNASDEEFAAQIGELVDVRDYQNWWLFMMFTGAIDTTGKNVYHYKESTSAAIRLVPWDFNASFGQNWSTVRTLARGAMLGRNGLWQRMVRDPKLNAEMRDRLSAALRGPFSVQEVLARFDQFVEEVEPAANRDWQRWGNRYKSYPRWSNRKDFTLPDEEVEYVRGWITARWEYLDSAVDELLPVGEDGGAE